MRVWRRLRISVRLISPSSVGTKGVQDFVKLMRYQRMDVGGLMVYGNRRV